MTGNRKRIKHFHEPGQLHEFTFSCYQRRQLLTNGDWLSRLGPHIDAAGETEGIELVAFVFMPEHIHLLTYPTVKEPDMGKYLARIKMPFSREIKALLIEEESPLLDELTVQERPGKTCFRFWQEGPGYDRNITTRQVILSSIDYLHLNPVRRGLSLGAIDWPWSSAVYYLSNPPKLQSPKLPRIHGLPVGALD